MSSCTITGTLYAPDGSKLTSSPVSFAVLTDGASRAAEHIPYKVQSEFTTDADGLLTAVIEAPSSGSWQYRMTIKANSASYDFYLAAGTTALTIDEVLALAGLAGSESGTPQASMLLGIYTDAQTATDGQLLTSDGAGGVAWEDAPETGIADAASDGNVYGRQDAAWVDLAGEFDALGAASTAVGGHESTYDHGDIPSTAEAAWVTAGKTAVPDAADLVDANNLGTAAYVDTIDEDDMASDSAAKVPTQQSVKAYVDANAGGGDVGDLTTTGLTAANMLRVAAAGGLEERTPANVLSDIGAEASGAAATVQGNLDTHTANTSNPHSVTAAQVAALPLAGGTLTGNLVMSTGQEIRATDNEPLIISARGNNLSYTKVTAQSGSVAVLDITSDTGTTELRINGKKAFGSGAGTTLLGLGQGFTAVSIYTEFQVVPLTGGGTVATNNMLYLGVQTNDTPVAGFGGSIKMVLESSTTTNRDAARIAVLWNNATHATRAADLVHYVTDYSAEREVLRLRATGTAAAISLFGATPQAQSTGWAVTNVTPDKVFDADSTSLDELADVLGTLITYLIARGDLAA